MRKILAFFPLLFLASCIPPLSLNPLMNEQERVAESGVIGRWVAGPDDQIDIRSKSDLEYTVRYFNDDGQTTYRGHLVRLDEELYLDLSVSDDGLEEQFHGQAFFPVVPAHFWLRLNPAGDQLEVAYFPVDDLEDLLESGEVSCPSAKSGDTLLLTGDTRQLQDLVRQLRGFTASWEKDTYRRLEE